MRARIVESMWEGASPCDRPSREDGEFHPVDPGGQWEFDHAGDCESPVLVNRTSAWGPEDHLPDGRGFYEITDKVRCRKCGPCLAARTRMWVARAAQEASLTAAAGRRSWFGTLTFRPDVHTSHEQLAFAEWVKDQPDSVLLCEAWEALPKDERFKFVRQQAIDEVQRYWKRLRKAGHAFKYLVVLEPHKSGRVHMHWLLHEQCKPILHRQLEAAWGRGICKIVLLGGRSKRSAGPREAAFYVAKYLSKSYQSRQLASARYGRGVAPRAPVRPHIQTLSSIGPQDRKKESPSSRNGASTYGGANSPTVTVQRETSGGCEVS